MFVRLNRGRSLQNSGLRKFKYLKQDAMYQIAEIEMFLTQFGDKVCLDLEDFKRVLLPERLNRVVIDDVLV